MDRGKIPREIEENLESGEVVKHITETFSVKNTPELLAVTNRRIMYLDKKLFGRYDFQTIPYMKLRSATAKIGAVMWGEFIVEGEDDRRIHLERVKKEGIISTFESMKEAINAIAIEPLSIVRKKRLFSEEWYLSKPPEMIMRQKSDSTPEHRIEGDPLKMLKMRYAKGEITKEEYEEMKKTIES